MSILNKLKNINIIKYDLLAIIIFFTLNFILYLNNLKIRLWFFLLVSFLLLIFFIIGNLKLIFNKETKSHILIMSILSLVLVGVILLYYVIFFFFFNNAFGIRKEYYMVFDDRSYIVCLKKNDDSVIEFYEYKNPFIMGNRVKIIANYGVKIHFNNESYDEPFFVKYYYYDSNNLLMKVEEVYYNEDKTINEREKVYPEKQNNYYSSNNRPLHNQDKYSNTDDNEVNNKDDIEDDTPVDKPRTLADCEVLYEKQFGNKILRYAVIDYALGQRLLTKVIVSEDDGKTFDIVTEGNRFLSLNSASQINFIDEQLTFVVPNTSMDSTKNIDIYVSQDGGKTFTNGTLLYDSNVYYIGIYDVPYLEDGYLKLKCLVYKYVDHKQEKVDWIFTTNNNGITWTFEKEQPIEE